MKFHLYQLVIVLISAFMIFSGIKNFIRGKSGQTFYKLMIRVFVWGGMSLIALFPSFTNVLAKFIGLQGNVNAVILSAFLLIFLMIFKLLSAIERLEQNISTLTRKESLKEIKKDI
jgi:hypothetical protein